MDGTYSNSQKYFGNNSTSPKSFWDIFQLPKKLCGTTSTFDLHKWDLFHSSFSFWDLVYCPHYPIQPHIGLEIEINNKASSFIRIQPITDDTVQHLKQCNVLRKDCWWQKWSAHMQNAKELLCWHTKNAKYQSELQWDLPDWSSEPTPKL